MAYRVAICFHAESPIEEAAWNDLQEDRASALKRLSSKHPSRVVRIEYLDGDSVTNVVYSWWGSQEGPAGLRDKSGGSGQGLQFESRRAAA